MHLLDDRKLELLVQVGTARFAMQWFAAAAVFHLWGGEKKVFPAGFLSNFMP